MDEVGEVEAVDAAQAVRNVARRGVGRGTLERRGEVWVGRWMWRGKRFYRNLGKFTGKNARAKAQAALDEEMRPYTAKSEAETVAHQAARAAMATGAVAESEERTPALGIDEAFDAWVVHPRRPRRAQKNGGQQQIDQYRARFKTLARWISENHSEVVEVRHISKDVAFEFLSWFEGAVSPNTYNKHLTLFTSMWEVLQDSARLSGNPWREASRLPQPKSVRRELTVEELTKISSSISGEMWFLFAVGIYTGLRLGDAVRIEWGMIDLKKNHLVIEPKKTERFSNGEPLLIPLVPQFRIILESISPERRRGRLTPTLAENYLRDKSGLCKKIQRVFADCGIETQQKTGGKLARVVVGFHSLRHTFVSIAAESGIPLAIVQAIVGHTSPAMTRHYLHVSALALQSNARKFPAVFGMPAAALPAPGEGVGGALEVRAVVSDNLPEVAGNVGGLSSDEVCAAVQGFDLGARLRVISACVKGMTASDFAAVRRVVKRVQDERKAV